MYIYIMLAKYFKVYDIPNERSSHTSNTIRGAGLIFPIAFILSIIFENIFFDYHKMIYGLLFISIISFLDDLNSINNTIRIITHSIAVTLLLFQLEIYIYGLLPFILSYIFVTGIINSYNFMDGINGITGLYSISILISIFYINTFYSLFSSEILLSLIVSIIIFLYYNFRNKAIIFSGDVGSISIGFILCFFIISLIIYDNNLKWILLLGIYGIDSVGSIVLRMIRKENIFNAHRSHLYQYLANSKNISHLLISIIYSLFQLALNYVILYQSNKNILLVFLVIILIYVCTRLKLEGFKRLFIKYDY